MVSTLLKRTRERIPYNPGDRELFNIAVPKRPPVWTGTHWINALSLSNAFARVVAQSGGVTLNLEIRGYQRANEGPLVCEMTYQFVDRGLMRRIMTLNAQVTGAGDGEAYIVDLPIGGNR
jgi:hypothetical protein